MQRWLDVNPRHWFYRSVLESDRMYLDKDKERSLFNGISYNVFEEGKERRVEVFTSTEGQKEFEVSGFIPDSRMDVLIYIEGKYVAPSKLEENYVHLPNPIGGQQEVVIILTGVPQINKRPCDPHETECGDGTCRESPASTPCGGAIMYPRAELSRMDDYIFDLNYPLGEVAVSLGKSLKRVNVDLSEDETLFESLQKAIGHRRDVFTIIGGVVYLPFELNDIPLYLNYNFISPEDGGIVKNMQGERLIPHSSCVLYNDRFFPNTQITRAEFFILLQRLRENFYNRYTDRGYVASKSSMTVRYVKDKEKIIGQWYEEEVLNVLDETFLDGCYVFPLYDDDTFEPEACVTRAETATYLHRFTEWALERFR